jgi:hypothetical protein
MYSFGRQVFSFVRPVMEKSPSHRSLLYPLHDASVWLTTACLVKATTSTSCTHFLKDFLNFSLVTTFYPRHRDISTHSRKVTSSNSRLYSSNSNSQDAVTQVFCRLLTSLTSESIFLAKTKELTTEFGISYHSYEPECLV